VADIDEGRKLFSEMRAELAKIRLSNAENFDKSVLTYSTAGLAFSLGFLKDFVPINQAAQPWLLYLSWAMFVACVVSTMSSFLLSQQAVEVQLRINERYYLRGEGEALKEANVFGKLTDVLNYFSAICFVAAIVCTTSFVGLNLEKAAALSQQKKAEAPACHRETT